jgi:hypothetical protein
MNDELPDKIGTPFFVHRLGKTTQLLSGTPGEEPLSMNGLF